MRKKISLGILLYLFLGHFISAQEIPFSVNTTLFNQNNTETVGLSKASGTETITIFSPTENTDHYSNGVVMVGFKGTLYCQWQSSNTDEDAQDTWVAYSKSTDGVNWSNPMILAESITDGYCTSGGWWANGDTLVAYINVWANNVSPRGGFAYYTYTTNGVNWSTQKRVKMADGSFLDGIFEQDPHALPDGRIINATHLQPGLLVHPIYTDDPSGMKGWKLGDYNNLPYSGDVTRELEPSWFRQQDGDAVMVFRDQNASYKRWASISHNRGETWSTAVETNMPDSRSKQSAGNLPDGTAFLVGSPVNNKTRWPLAVTLSKDGEYFDKAYLLRAGGSDLPAQRYSGLYKTLGYNYPKSMVWDNHLYVAYATNKEEVEYTRIPLTSLNLVCENGYLDNCEVCINATTSNQPCTGSLEAEEACYVDGIQLENKNSGFSGEGYLNTDNQIDKEASWLIKSNKAQTITLSFRYANGGTTSRDGKIFLNNSSKVNLVLPSTGGWSNWRMATVNVDIDKGSNDLTLKAITIDGLANIDLIAFSGDIESANCIITSIDEFVDSELYVYPNPTLSNLHWDSNLKWVLKNSNGQVLNKGMGKNVDLSTYSEGLYLLEIEGEMFKVLKQ